VDRTRLLIWLLILKVCGHRPAKSSTWKNKHFHPAPPGQISCTRTLTKFVGGLFKVLHHHHQHVPAHEKIAYIYIFLSCSEPCRYVLKDSASLNSFCRICTWSSPLHRTSGNWSEAHCLHPLSKTLEYFKSISN
jgi:hypothetical protein